MKESPQAQGSSLYLQASNVALPIWAVLCCWAASPDAGFSPTKLLLSNSQAWMDLFWTHGF